MPVGIVVQDLAFHLAKAGLCMGCQRPAIGLTKDRAMCSSCHKQGEEAAITRALVDWERWAA